jgi:hypothetical protein
LKISTYKKQWKYHAKMTDDLKLLLSNCKPQDVEKSYSIHLSIISQIDQIIEYLHIQNWCEEQFQVLRNQREQYLAQVRQFEQALRGKWKALQYDSTDVTQSSRSCNITTICTTGNT